MEHLTITEEPTTTAAAWPIRVGGVYRCKDFPILKRVTAIYGGMVYFQSWHVNQPDQLSERETVESVFRSMQMPEDESPLPRLRTAAQLALDALEHSTPGDCWAEGPHSGDIVADLVACPGCRARNALLEALGHAR